MRKNTFSMMLFVAVVLGVVTALTWMLATNSFRPQVAERESYGMDADADMEVPMAPKALDANWKPVPVAGAPVTLPFPNIHVSNDGTNEPKNEPFIAVDPANARHIVVGANSWAPGNGTFEVVAYVTFDGGRTWTASQPYIDRNPGRLNAADPTLAFGPDGSVYFAFVALTPASGAVAVSRSGDGGLTWTSQHWATSFSISADKPSLAAANNNLYVFYQGGSLFSTISPDGGATWSTAAAIEARAYNAYPVVDNKGNVNVFYNTSNSIKLARFSNISASIANFKVTTVSNTVPMQPRAGQYRATIYPTGAADAAGNLYVAWTDGRNAGRGNDILLSASRDGGATWTSPVTVNSDSSSADQLMPSVTAGSDGWVSVAWVDTRNDPANVNYDVYMARSKDGAAFGANQRLTTISSNPNNDPRLQGTMIGDYITLAAGRDVVYSVWTDTRNNHEDIYMAPVPVKVLPNN